MRVWDRSKLQEWKQISRQDDFKQTVQNMGVSTMCTPSPPLILLSDIYIYIVTLNDIENLLGDGMDMEIVGAIGVWYQSPAKELRLENLM